jgi:hypothetical protein
MSSISSIGSAPAATPVSGSQSVGTTPSAAQAAAVANLAQISAALTQSLGALASGIGGSVDVSA